MGVIPAFLNHWTSWNQDAEFSVIAVCPTLLSRATGAQGEVELVPQVSVEDLVIEQLALALRAKIQTGCLSGRLYGEPLGIAIAARLAGNYGVSRPKIKASGLSRSQLARVVDYMQANLARDLSVLDLAALTGMSESHFSRSFKRLAGVSPYRYLVRLRVERAKVLLAGRSVSISAVALDCGFANQTHLTKVFRRVVGVTPGVYQRR